jgi:hypothetical protein
VSLLIKHDTDNNMITIAFIIELLNKLKPVDTAFYNHIGVPACLEGTREQLLDDIAQWMEDPASKKVFWLTGAAGTGKTTIARSIAEMAKGRNLLGATFFFSRTSADRGDFKRVIPTIAYQLAQDLRLRSRIAAAIDDDNTLSTADVSIQAEKLLLETLRVPIPDPPSCLLLVVDALDECNKDDNDVHGGDLIPQLLVAVKGVSFVKVFLTSRPGPSIETMFIDEDLGDATLTLALHRDIEEQTVQSDIRHYLRVQLSELRKRVRNNPNFPEESSINILVKRAGTLFIYARTVVQYVSSSRGISPDRRLAALIRAEPELSSLQYGPLDSLYKQILRTAHDGFGGGSVADKCLRSILIALVLVRRELTMYELIKLTGVDEDTCSEVLGLMSAILNYRHGSAEPVRLMHLSFSEFLSDPKRCSELDDYAIDPSCDHLWLTERCLESLNTHLSVTLLSNKDTTTQLLSKFVWYCCKFWPAHWLEHARQSYRPGVVPQSLHAFCTLGLPRWINAIDSMHGSASADPLDQVLQACSILQVCFVPIPLFES